MARSGSGAVSSVGDKIDRAYRIDQERCWQQFVSTCILINAPQWLQKLFVKAEIPSQTFIVKATLKLKPPSS